MLSSPVHAVVQKFGANEHNTVWISKGDNKFHCSLKQTIPNFGEATFRRSAGGNLNLRVELIHPNRAEREVELISKPPLWRHEQGNRLLDSLQLNEPSSTIKFDSKQARVVLTELEQGLFPTLRYYVAEDNNREVHAAISSVSFHPSYNQFLTCLSQLMPYQFDYVQESKFYFRSGKSSLSAIDKRRLNELVTYVKADPEIKWAQIKGYTDSRGFRHYNDRLGERRAKAIQNYLASKGVDKLTISTKSYGERLPLESNRTNKGRAQNRVAVFTLFNKEPPPPEELPEFEFESIFDSQVGQEPQFKATIPEPRSVPAPQAQPEQAPVIVAPIQADAVESPPQQELVMPEPTKPEKPVVKAKPEQSQTAEEPADTRPQLFTPITADMVESGN